MCKSGAVRSFGRGRASSVTEREMDEKDFKKHLKELAHGQHHAEEHDWPEGGEVRTVDEPEKTAAAPAKKNVARKPRRRAK
jgi:hypothetical protein